MKFLVEALLIACWFLLFGGISQAQSLTSPHGGGATSQPSRTNHGISFDFANLDVPVAGVAAGETGVFAGEPLNASVVVLSRLSGQQIGVLPPPPNGFAVPFIMHIVAPGRLAVLDAGGLPQPSPFVPAMPVIYEYTYGFGPGGFSATL